MTMLELRSTFEYSLLTTKQKAYVQNFVVSRDSVASARIAYSPRKRDTLYSASKRNRKNAKVQACIARYDVESRNGALVRLKEGVLGRRKMSRREREDLKFIARYEVKEGCRPFLTDEEKVMLFEPHEDSVKP